MRKLKLNIPSSVGDVLTSEELKHVLGGEGSGSEPEPTYCYVTCPSGSKEDRVAAICTNGGGCSNGRDYAQCADEPEIRTDCVRAD